jgi:hypothetical protein
MANVTNIELWAVPPLMPVESLVPGASMAVSLRFDEDMTGRSVAVRAFNIAAFVSTLSRAPGKTRSMIDPFGVEIDLHEKPDKSVLEGELDALSIRVSYQVRIDRVLFFLSVS